MHYVKLLFTSILAFSLSLSPLCQAETSIQDKTPAPTNKAIILKIGAALALSGFSSSWGLAELNGIQLAVNEINQSDDFNFKLDLTVEDCQSSNQTVLSALNKLINVDQLKIILGPTWLDSYQAGLHLIEKTDALLITPSAAVGSYQSEHKVWPRVFSTSTNFQNETILIVDYLKKKGVKKIALFYDEDPFNVMYFNRLKQELETARNPLTATTTSFSLDHTDFRSSLIKAESQGIEAIVYSFGVESSYHTFLKQRLEIFPKALLVGTSFADSYGEKEEFKALVEGLVFPLPTVKEQSFYQKYLSRFGEVAGVSSSYAYDAAYVLASALKSGARTPEEIDLYLRSNTFNSVSFGPFKFNKFGGVDEGLFIMKKYQNGRKVLVD